MYSTDAAIGYMDAGTALHWLFVIQKVEIYSSGHR